MRLFIGIELDDRVRAGARTVAEALRARIEEARLRIRPRWIPPDNLHVTLVFIGEVSDARAADVLAAMDAPFDATAFELGIGGLGAFPPSGGPRIFWLGVRSGAERMSALYTDLTGRLRSSGYEPEVRPYHAHVTIARIPDAPRGRENAVIRRLLQELPADAGSCRVDHVTVFRSRLSPKGAAYEAVLRVPLS